MCEKCRAIGLRRILQVGFAVLALFLNGCRRSELSPEGEFSIRVNVVDPGGKAVSGLQISMFNEISPVPVDFRGMSPHPISIAAVTSLRIDAPALFVGSLTIRDLGGKIIAELMDGSAYQPGAYAFHWSIPEGTPNGVYRCLFLAHDTAKTKALYTDSILIAFHQVDPQMSVVGWTNGLGVFETTDRLLVPYLLNLGPIPMTDATGPAPLGSFRYVSTIAVTLTDTTSHQTMSIHSAIADQPNIVNVTWNSLTPASSLGRAGESSSAVVQSDLDSVIVIIPASWRLYQNYPNPFN